MDAVVLPNTPIYNKHIRRRWWFTYVWNLNKVQPFCRVQITLFLQNIKLETQVQHLPYVARDWQKKKTSFLKSMKQCFYQGQGRHSSLKMFTMQKKHLFQLFNHSTTLKYLNHNTHFLIKACKTGFQMRTDSVY